MMMIKTNTDRKTTEGDTLYVKINTNQISTCTTNTTHGNPSNQLIELLSLSLFSQ